MLDLFGLTSTFDIVPSSGGDPAYISYAQTYMQMAGLGDFNNTFTFADMDFSAIAASTWDVPEECPDTPVCAAALDLVFVLDGSGSVSPSNFNLEKDFVAQLLPSFQVARVPPLDTQHHAPRLTPAPLPSLPRWGRRRPMSPSCNSRTR